MASAAIHAQEVPSTSDTVHWHAEHTCWSPVAFEVDFTALKSISHLRNVDIDAVTVAPGVKRRHQNIYTSDWPEMPLAMFMDSLPKPASNTTARQKKESSTARLVREVPWAEKFVNRKEC